jgi:hypothetical protein
METSLLERLELLYQRERSFQDDHKEVNQVPNNLDYNRVLDNMRDIINDFRGEQIIKQKEKQVRHRGQGK